MANDPHNLQRFIDAQESMCDKVLAELKEGKKRSHWMWFMFPQTPKMGMGSVAKRFAIRSLDEAKAYLAHPVLGIRLHECIEAVPIGAVVISRLLNRLLLLISFWDMP